MQLKIKAFSKMHDLNSSKYILSEIGKNYWIIEQTAEQQR